MVVVGRPSRRVHRCQAAQEECARGGINNGAPQLAGDVTACGSGPGELA